MDGKLNALNTVINKYINVTEVGGVDGKWHALQTNPRRIDDAEVVLEG